MSHIKYIPYDKANPPLKKVLEKYGGESKRPDNIVNISSVNPLAMEGHMGLYRSVHKGPSPISRLNREMIAVMVSGINGCHY
ncbi:MAG: peroxidase [Proteobacteria bacterium]|nr:peroxidase [Pseudomonadota bacterium]